MNKKNVDASQNFEKKFPAVPIGFVSESDKSSEEISRFFSGKLMTFFQKPLTGNLKMFYTMADGMT